MASALAGSEEKELEEEEAVDPRIQNELEQLNETSSKINELENNLDELRISYRNLLTDSASKLEAMKSKLGNCVEKARPYYQAKAKHSKALHNSQAAARTYNRAYERLEAAKQIVLNTESNTGSLDPAILEMLNHATTKVNEAKVEFSDSQREHETLTVEYNAADVEVRRFLKELRSDIKKAEPYFKTVQKFNQRMEEEKMRVESYQEKVNICKTIYKDALDNLEKISLEIHNRREEAKVRVEMGDRGEGVGAEEVITCPVEQRPTLEDTSRRVSLKDEDIMSWKDLPGSTANAAVEAMCDNLPKLTTQQMNLRSVPSKSFSAETISDSSASTGRQFRSASTTSASSVASRRMIKLGADPIAGILREQLKIQNQLDSQLQRARSISSLSKNSADSESLHTLDDEEFDIARWELDNPPAYAQPNHHSVVLSPKFKSKA